MNRFPNLFKKPNPDIDGFMDIIMGRKIPDRVPPCEYLIDNAVMKPILTDILGREWVEMTDKTEYMGGQMDFSRDSLELTKKWLDNQIAFWLSMGYDYIRMEASLRLPAVSLLTEDTASANRGGMRAWQGLGDGPITDWEAFEKYPWPQMRDSDFFIHEYISNNIPEGLGFITCHAGGVYEHTSRLMGYANLCQMLYDDPQLVKAVADKIGGLIYAYNCRLLEIPRLSAVFQGDDYGFNTQTLVSPDDLRKYFLPWQQKFAAQCHEKNKPYFLHSCGMITDIADDLIDTVAIDAKHSFQDYPGLSLAEFKSWYGGRVALLGGLDIDKLATLDPPTLRKYVRSIIEVGAPGGRFAVGSGNSIASYIPPENYLTMMDEIFNK